MKTSKKILSSNPDEFADSPDKVRVFHMLFNFIPNIPFFGFFYFHGAYLTIRLYKPFAIK